MNNISIKDYLNLREIHDYLLEEVQKEYRENNGYSNNVIAKHNKMLSNLETIIGKLEKED